MCGILGVWIVCGCLWVMVSGEGWESRWNEGGRTLLADDGGNAHDRIAKLRSELDDLRGKYRSLDFEKGVASRALQQRRAQKQKQEAELKNGESDAEHAASALEELRSKQGGSLNDELVEMEKTQKELEDGLAKMRKESAELDMKKQELLKKLELSGLDHYFDAYSKELNPVLKGVVIKSSEVITPFLHSITFVADTNNRLVEHVSSEIDSMVHLNVKQSPFISGLLFYCIILIPVLPLSMLVVQIIKTTINLTVSHFVLFGSVYLFLLSLLFGVSSLFTSGEPTDLFRRRHGGLFIFSMLFLSFLYVMYVLLIAMQSLSSKNSRDSSQLVAVIVVGLHFFWFAWKPSILDQEIRILPFAYYIYATMLGFIIYERTERLHLLSKLEDPGLRKTGTEWARVTENFVVRLREFTARLVSPPRGRKTRR
uniref:Uncharacterized protein n=2 Tax=Compsopogon caeruleus TaxID=31354 RepID=A0A7S1TIH8_9RHOD|mmetsp:Transcript_8114/g.16349  ORF Transcript_8114/g.16349 Transcript_8114/m.16349 type:complete len:426 (+) Transcript_8114:1225-2502(+)